MATCKLLIHSARQIVRVDTTGARCLTGDKMRQVDVLEAGEGQGLSLVVDREGKIAAIGSDVDIAREFEGQKFLQKIDATGKCVLPGLVDAHTHPVWEGDRVHEFAMKLAGASYMEVHAAGGGIHFTVRHTRQASEDALFQGLQERLGAMTRAGTTLVECKSGYGLETATELKMLRVMERARLLGGVDISITYCGAHAVPEGKTAEETTKDVLTNQLPEIHRHMDSGRLHVDNIDVFCERGVFDTDQSRRILQAGMALGLLANFHGDELHPMKSAEMGASIGATAISHLEEVSKEGIAAMAKEGTVGVILPTTAHILRLRPPPVRDMIDAGVPVALGSDFNPNAYCLSMPAVMHLACVSLRMTMEEALVAATLNAAAALGKSRSHGSLAPGKVANLLVLNAPRWEHLVYQLACHDSVIDCVIWHGDVVHRRQSKQDAST